MATNPRKVLRVSRSVFMSSSWFESTAFRLVNGRCFVPV
jgi:hypothetical protein